MTIGTIRFPQGLGDIVYEADYHSGSGALVYFEDILVDDIVRIAFGVQQQRTPIYGYASQYYNAIADGVVMVSGSFWIAFKEVGYIPIILRHIAQRRTEGEAEGSFASPARRSGGDLEIGGGLIASSRRYSGGTEEGGARQSTPVTRADIERMLERDDEAELTELVLRLGALDDRQFEDVAEMFEDACWYGGNTDRDGRGDSMSGNYRGGELENSRFLAVRRADQYPPFDILVTFGDINNPAANHSVHRLLDVTIVGSEFSGIEPTGDPIMTRFDFVARNIM